MSTVSRQQPEPAEGALRALAEAAQRLFAAGAAVVTPVNPVTEVFYGRPVAVGEGGDGDTGRPFDPNDPRLTEAARRALRGSGLYEEVSFGDEGGCPTPGGMRSFLAVPLRGGAGNKPLALLWLGFRRARPFGTEDETRLDFFNGQFAPFLQNFWQLKRFEQVLLIGQEMNQQPSAVGDLFEVLSRRVADFLDLSHFFMLALCRPHTDRLDIYYSLRGERGVIWDRSLTGVTAWVIESGTPLIVTSFSDRHQVVSLLPEEGAGANPESLIFVPLMFRSTVLGVLSVQHPSPHAFDESDLQVVSLLANQLALAVNNLRLFDHLTTLNRVGRALTGQLDSNELPGLVAHSIREATDADVVTLLPYDAPTGRFEQAAISGALIDPELAAVVDERQPDDVARLSIERGSPLWADDSTRLYELLAGQGRTRAGDFERRERIVSTAVVPLRVGGSTAGVLFVSYRRRQHFDATQRTLILSLADYATIALRNSHTLLALSRRRLNELEALREIEQKMVTQLDDPGQVMSVVMAESMKLVGADLCQLHLYDEGRQWTTYRARKDEGPTPQPRRYDNRESLPRHSLVMHVAETLLPYVIPDTSTQHLYRGGPGVRSAAAFPLVSDGRLIGVLNLESYESNAFDADDVRLLQVFVGQAVIALRKAAAYTRAKVKSQRFQLLYEAGRELSKITEADQLEKAYDIVAAEVGQFTDGEVVIRRYDPATESLVLVRAARPLRPLPQTVLKDAGVNGQAARERRVIRIDDMDNLPEGVAEPVGDDPSVKALVVVPLLSESAYYGNLVVSHERANSFDDDDINLLRGLAGQLAITINRIEAAQARVEAERSAKEHQVMSAVGQTTMALTHRLGNDLGLVRIYAKNVIRAAEAQGIDAGPIKENVDRIVRDVSNVLEMSRGVKRALASVGGPSAERTPMSAGELLEMARQYLPPLPADIAAAWQCDDPAAKVRVSPGAVADILSNLVVNAAQAMPGGGAVRVRSYVSGPSLCVEVSDTGPGVPETLQPRLFNLFFSTKRSSGFGLWSARQYARASGGDLTYERREGVGATFVLRLPLAPAQEEAE